MPRHRTGARSMNSSFSYSIEELETNEAESMTGTCFVMLVKNPLGRGGWDLSLPNMYSVTLTPLSTTPKFSTYLAVRLEVRNSNLEVEEVQDYV